MTDCRLTTVETSLEFDISEFQDLVERFDESGMEKLRYLEIKKNKTHGLYKSRSGSPANRIISVTIPEYVMTKDMDVAKDLVRLALEADLLTQKGMHDIYEVFEDERIRDMADSLSERMNSKGFIESQRKEFMKTHRLYSKKNERMMEAVERLQILGYIGDEWKDMALTVFTGKDNARAGQPLSNSWPQISLGSISEHSIYEMDKIPDYVMDVLVLMLVRAMDQEKILSTRIGEWYTYEKRSLEQMVGDYHNLEPARKWMQDSNYYIEGMYNSMMRIV